MPTVFAWDYVGKDTVMKIVEEFRKMGATAGVKGRQGHRPFPVLCYFPVPAYPYQAGLTKEAKEAMEEAKANGKSVCSPPGNEKMDDSEVNNMIAGGQFATVG